MKKILAAILFLLMPLPAIAADNALTVTVGSGLTMRTIDIGGGVQSSGVNLVSATGTSILGTAGTANAAVLTIQGIASGTVVPVSLTSTTITGTVAATQSGTWNVGTVTAVTGITNPVAVTGTFWQATQPVSGTVTAAQATAASLNATVVGTGTFVTQSTLAAETTKVIGTVNIAAAQTIAATNAGTFVVQAQPIPVTTGGLTNYFVQPTASDNHVVIKAGAGQVYKVSVTNNSATVNYLRLYNATTGFNGCNSATNLIYQMAIPASTAGAGYSDSWDLGIAFATGISICVTSGYATNDTTNATASAMSVNVGYK